MDITQILHNLIFDYTLRTVALGSAILGIVSGALGSYAVLRKQSLLGDAISHATLPGVVLAFLITRSKAPIVLMLGAILAGWLATLWMMSIVRTTRIKEDSSLGMVLSVFFGFGLVLLTFTQRLPDARQAGLDRYLFGQAATLLQSDVISMAIVGALALGIQALLWKEFKLLTFDREFGGSLGLSIRLLDVLLITLLVLAIVIGLQAVGVVLMSAMIVAPAVAARQWTDRLGVMVTLSACFGALAGVSGAVISSITAKLSTGPTVVLCISAIVVFSLLFAPNRGLIVNRLRQQRSQRQLRLEAVLLDLYSLAIQHTDREHAHTVDTLRAMSTNQGDVERSLSRLAEGGLAREVTTGAWALTPPGMAEAQKISQNTPQNWASAPDGGTL